MKRNWSIWSNKKKMIKIDNFCLFLCCCSRFQSLDGSWGRCQIGLDLINSIQFNKIQFSSVQFNPAQKNVSKSFSVFTARRLLENCKKLQRKTQYIQSYCSRLPLVWCHSRKIPVTPTESIDIGLNAIKTFPYHSNTFFKWVFFHDKLSGATFNALDTPFRWPWTIYRPKLLPPLYDAPFLKL